MTDTWRVVRGPYPAVLGTDWRDGSISAFFHPEERCVWIAALNKDSGGIFRLVDGEPQLVCDRAGLGRASCNFAELVCYFDATTKRPTLLGDDWQGKSVGEMGALEKAGTIASLFALELDGSGAVRERALGISGQFEGYTDRFVVDGRGQLYHLSRPNQRPPKLRRFDGNTVTVVADAPEALTDRGTLAACGGAYDRALDALVFLYDGRTWIYRDGWTDLEGPESRRLGKSELLATDPATGHVVLVRAEKDEEPSAERFDGERWHAMPPPPVEYRTVVSTPDALVFVQARATADRPLRAWVSWDPQTNRFTEGGPILDAPHRIAVGPAGSATAHRDHVMWTPRAGEPQKLPSPHLTAIAVTGDGPVGFTTDGRAHALASSTTSPAPAEFLPRIGGACTYDPSRNGVLWISGVAVEGSRVPKDAWLLANGTLEPVALKPTIGVTGGCAAYSPALERVVVAGGSSKWKTPTPSPTFEIAGGKTAAFDPFACETAATDEPTGIAVFASTERAGAYLGGGTWHRFAPTPEDARTVWYDPATRTLRATCRRGPLTTEHALPVGDALDGLAVSAPPAPPPRPAPTRRKKSR